ncbi:MAG: hypothetical protein WCO78_02955 [Candidatus Roizmanbacteria bacterium]
MIKQKISAPVKGTTQQFIEIEDVVEDVVLMKGNAAATIIEVGAVNFYLLSAEEQSSMVYSYGNLLNSLSFPVQIVILSKKMDISIYLEYLNGKITQQPQPLIKSRLQSYQEFIKSVIKKNTVLEKRFFFVIPFNPLEMGVSGVKSMHKDYLVSRAKISLYPKRDHLLRLLSKIGLRSTTLQQQEIVELFYNVYNPSATGRQLAPVPSYTYPIMTQ